MRRQKDARLIAIVEGTVDAQRARVRQTDARRKMRKILADRQGRRGEDPGAGPRFHVLAQAFGDFEGRELQQQAAGRGLDPAQTRLVRQLAQLPPAHWPECAARRAQLAVPAPAPRPSSCAAKIAQGGLDFRQRVQKRIRQTRPLVAARRRAAALSQFLETRLHGRERRLDQAGARTAAALSSAAMSRSSICTWRTDQTWPKNCAAISGT